MANLLAHAVLLGKAVPTDWNRLAANTARPSPFALENLGLSTNVMTTAESSSRTLENTKILDGLKRSVFDCSEKQEAGLKVEGGVRTRLERRTPQPSGDGSGRPSRLPFGFAEAYAKNVSLSSPRRFATIGADDPVALHEATSALVHPQLTLETGFANGGSAVAIMSALPSHPVHMAIDPFQVLTYNGTGLKGVANSFNSGLITPGLTFVHVNETAATAMASLVRAHTCVDLITQKTPFRADHDHILEPIHP